MAKNAEAVLTVFSDGSVEPGPGISLGDLLRAVDLARNALLGVVLRPAPPQGESTGDTGKDVDNATDGS